MPTTATAAVKTTPTIATNLRIHNTLTRTKQKFEPLVPGQVTMYVCGPTVYKPSHIGHMVGPVIFDTVKRYLAYLGYQVTWVVNITDVDDKLIVRARELNTTVKELAEKMTGDYIACLHSLNVTGIDKMPKATETLDEMLSVIKDLIAKGYAYPAAGDVYFDVSKDEDYGKLCNRDPEQMEAGARIEVTDRKRNPGDFALWKGAKPGEPAWDSPWGPGRPGWHIECTAMSMKLLGPTLDIHGGGLDLQFPHHENELAQSESHTGKTFVRYWMHNGLLKMGKGKMAGSVGNVLNVVDALTKTSAEVLRFFIVNTHYRSPIDLGDFDPKVHDIPSGLAAADKSFETFLRFAQRYERITGTSFYKLNAPTRRDDSRQLSRPEFAQLATKYVEHMDDDFNTGGAVGVMFELVTALNRLADEAKLEADPKAAARADFEQGALLLKEFMQVLGLMLTAPASPATGADGDLVGKLMKLIIELRAEARKTKNFAMADQIRKGLTELNIVLEDRANETSWSAKK
ncbi:MAG: cysteine--tRNA ligase [Planctomycetes bacterium]|nr:cysteine--tRNA ligase [Planctomycetota bacterium]